MRRKKNRFIRIALNLILLMALLKCIPFLSTTFFNLGKIESNMDYTVSNHTLDDNYNSYEDIKSRNAAVIDKDTNTVIMGKNPQDRINPASMTKVMTAIIGLENVKNLNRRVEITGDIINYCNTNGLSVSGFEEGDKPKVIDLIYGILLESGGESSIALAREVSYSEEGFIELMNKKAMEIGMVNTHFSNSTGITDSENYSTSQDIALLFDYALKNNKFKKIITTKEYSAYGLKGIFTKHTVYNRLLQKRNDLNLNKDYIQGGKTGYTEEAGLCLVSFGTVNGREYIVVTAGADGDSTTPQYNLLDSFKLYEELKDY